MVMLSKGALGRQDVITTCVFIAKVKHYKYKACNILIVRLQILNYNFAIYLFSGINSIIICIDTHWHGLGLGLMSPSNVTFLYFLFFIIF